ncbi:hypothetical protein KJ068_04305 [bacterium]|nr:hypothetical protein [bacterium]
MLHYSPFTLPHPSYLRPPLGGINDGAGGFVQDRLAALLGNDGEQRFTPWDKAV